jgi:Uma2 family endonuclease
MTPPPEPPHDDLDDRLNRSLVTFLAQTGDSGRVFHPRAAIYTTNTYVEPDMMYLSAESQAKMGKRRTSADIVFEYASRSNANYDRTTKADTCLALGVKELWLLDSDSKTIEVRNAFPGDAGPTWTVRQFGIGDFASSLVLIGWQVSVDAIFAGP